MEIFLLLLDDLDDAVGVLRSRWRSLLGLLLALALFAMTTLVLMQWPRLALLAAVPAVGLALSLVMSRAQPKSMPRLKTDP